MSLQMFDPLQEPGARGDYVDLTSDQIVNGVKTFLARLISRGFITIRPVAEGESSILFQCMPDGSSSVTGGSWMVGQGLWSLPRSFVIGSLGGDVNTPRLVITNTGDVQVPNWGHLLQPTHQHAQSTHRQCERERHLPTQAHASFDRHPPVGRRYAACPGGRCERNVLSSQQCSDDQRPGSDGSDRPTRSSGTHRTARTCRKPRSGGLSRPHRTARPRW